MEVPLGIPWKQKSKSLKVLQFKPIYDFVKTSKIAAGEDQRMGLHDWVKNNLSIDLLKGTSVLNPAYQDTDESLVLQVLNKVSKTYQEYSNLDNKNQLTMH